MAERPRFCCDDVFRLDVEQTHNLDLNLSGKPVFPATGHRTRKRSFIPAVIRGERESGGCADYQFQKLRSRNPWPQLVRTVHKPSSLAKGIDSCMLIGNMIMTFGEQK